MAVLAGGHPSCHRVDLPPAPAPERRGCVLLLGVENWGEGACRRLDVPQARCIGTARVRGPFGCVRIYKERDIGHDRM